MPNQATWAALRAFPLAHALLREQQTLNFKTHLKERGYSETLTSTTLAEIKFEDRKLALQQRRKQNTRILLPSVPNLKHILMQNWYLIQQQPLPFA